MAIMTKKDPKEKIARKRLSVLELAESLGNVTEACKRMGMDRTSFYAYKKRFREMGFAGLKDFSTAPLNHPQTTPQEHLDRLFQVSLKYPAWGSSKLSMYLKHENIFISSPIVQKHLIRNGMGQQYDRILILEKKRLEEGLELSAEQVQLIEKLNPAFAERHVESSKPGELLSQDTKLVGTLSKVGRIYLHAVVDTYGSYGFGFLHISKQPEAAVAVIHNDVLPKYQAWGLPVETILTDNGREFCGTESHPYELYLALCDIEHRRTKVRSPKTNGFVERFHRTVVEEFFKPAFRKKLYTSIQELQDDLDDWLVHYNTERPHLGYRNNGRRPIETVEICINKGTENV